MPLAPLKDPWQQVPIVEDGEEVRFKETYLSFTGYSTWIDTKVNLFLLPQVPPHNLRRHNDLARFYFLGVDRRHDDD